MKADSAGIELEPIVCAVKRAAPTWPPITAPIMRTTVFIPLATPISSASTLSAISPAIAANAPPTPMPSSALRYEHVPGLVVGDSRTATPRS